MYRVYSYIQAYRYAGCHTVVKACKGFDLTYTDTEILAVTQ